MSSGVAEDSPAISRVPTLDGVRGVAILVVIVHNAMWVAESGSYLAVKILVALAATGWVGVQLFFVLSGFLITGILLDSKGKAGYFRSFYIRRGLRILPVYFLLVSVAVVVARFVVRDTMWAESVLANQWSYWFYYSNWIQPFRSGTVGLSHLWSLAVEEQFYLAWPFVVWWLPRRQLMVFCLALLTTTPLIRWGIRLIGLPELAAYTFTISRWDALAAGALVSLLLRDPAGRDLLLRWYRIALAVSGAGLLALLVWQRGFHSDELAVQVIGQTLVSIASAILIVAAIVEGPAAPVRLQRFLAAGWLRALGKYSYAMYLFHFPISQFLTALFGEQVRGADTLWRLPRLGAYVVIVFGLTILAAMASWRLIEQPLLGLKDRIAPRPV